MIMSIGVIAVKENFSVQNQDDLDKIPTLLVRPNLDDQEKCGRKISLDTLRWWLSQDQKLFQDNIFQSSGKDSLETCYRLITEFLNDHGFQSGGLKNVIWSRGLFEVPLWENLCETVGEPNPISYWLWRDSRTACSVLGSDKRILDKFNLKKHSPVDDCLMDFLLITQGNK